ncbi:MAG TPA: SAV_6107 family HEPN domain-containing protein [Dermatophilaceae bacterium]|jgi:SAV_6107-like HEPN
MRTTSPRAPLASTALDLLDRARTSLLSACHADTIAERYVEAHLAALRAAAALLAARSRPSRRSQLRSVWEVLPQVAPELTEWAVFFAASAKRRAALERGSVGPGAREADDLLRQSETFFELVQGALGLPVSRPLPELAAVTGRQPATRQAAT